VYYSTMELVLFFAAVLISTISSAYVKHTMKKYEKEMSRSGLTGEQCAREILNRNGIGYIPVEVLPGDGGDHYSTATSSIGLSHSNFYRGSLTALSVAAHECGHALQHNENYPAMILRQGMVPVARFGSSASWILILIGVILRYNQFFINLGILAFALVVVFSLVTLPIEFDASRRALVMLESYGITSPDETKKCKEVLVAAALTYVASTAVAVLQIVKLLLRYGGNSRGRRS